MSAAPLKMGNVMRRVMRNTSLTVAAIGLLASQASAADLGRPSHTRRTELHAHNIHRQHPAR